jgi:hypothetical protein
MDLIVAVAQQRHPERTTADLAGLIDNLAEAQANEIFANAMQIDADEIGVDNVVGFVQEKLMNAIQAVTGEDWWRSVIVLDLDNGSRIAIGGGDSWGDTPVGFDEINFLELWGQW